MRFLMSIAVSMFFMFVPLFSTMAQTDGKVVELTQDKFKVLVNDYTDATTWKFNGARHAVIDFSATWCGPCKRLSPILDELAAEYAGEIDFYKVDVDKNKDLAQAYGVTSVPMVLFCPADGSKPTVITGAYPKKELEKVIEYVFNKNNNRSH